MRRLLILACTVVFLDVTFFAVLTPLLPDYRDDHALSEAGVGVLSGSFAAGTLVMALPAGWFAAHFGPRRAVLTGLAGIGVFSPVFGLADHIVLLDVSRFFQGASGALMWAGAMTWVITSGQPEQRGALVGTVIAAAVVGELAGAPLGAVAHQVGTEIVFTSVLFLAIGLGLLAMTIPVPAVTERQAVRPALAAARQSKLGRAVMILLAPSVAFGMVIVIAPLRMDDLGASPFLIAAAFALGSVTEAVIGPFIGRYSDRAGRTGPYAIGLSLLAIAVAVIGIFNVLPVLFAAVVLMAFASGIAFTPASALLTDVASSAGINQGYASGASNVAWGGGQMAGAFGGGILAGAAGFILPCMLTVILLGTMATVARRTEETAPAVEVAG
ncbi:MAG TPA: MFS transporter [Solirubrobacterales bacterium]|nr:MFS transporter [Solirubrobacterales bacterium]